MVFTFHIHLTFFLSSEYTGLFKMIVRVLTLVIHKTLEIEVCSCTDGSRNSRSFLL